jgi:hypothetical protein
MPLLLPPHPEGYGSYMSANYPSRWHHMELKRQSINKILERLTVNGTRDVNGVKYTSQHPEILVKAEKVYEESRKEGLWKTEYDFNGTCADFLM